MVLMPTIVLAAGESGEDTTSGSSGVEETITIIEDVPPVDDEPVDDGSSDVAPEPTTSETLGEVDSIQTEDAPFEENNFINQTSQNQITENPNDFVDETENSNLIQTPQDDVLYFKDNSNEEISNNDLNSSEKEIITSNNINLNSQDSNIKGDKINLETSENLTTNKDNFNNKNIEENKIKDDLSQTKIIEQNSSENSKNSFWIKVLFGIILLMGSLIGYLFFILLNNKKNNSENF